MICPDDDNRVNGGHVATLRGGAIYTTVAEESVGDSLRLPQAGPATDVTLWFRSGRVAAIEASDGGAELEALFDGRSGESLRVSHVGIGLNPHVRRSLGWVLVHEHVHGVFLFAMGDNLYLGGENASSLNVDFCLPDTTIVADDLIIVKEGKVIVPQSLFSLAWSSASNYASC